jgi:hypothetical protein
MNITLQEWKLPIEVVLDTNMYVNLTTIDDTMVTKRAHLFYCIYFVQRLLVYSKPMTFPFFFLLFHIFLPRNEYRIE